MEQCTCTSTPHPDYECAHDRRIHVRNTADGENLTVPSKTATTGGGGLILEVMLVTTTKVIRGIYFNIISHTNSHPQK